VAGKGGSGKTSLSSLIIRYLVKNKEGAVLAVDADANANLGDGLGLEVAQTIGGVLAQFNDEKMSIPAGLTKNAYLEIKMNQSITESKKLDLLTMGRGEGDGCYCYPNSVLRNFIDKLAVNYNYIVMDNEAGMEHLSRRTTEHIDLLFIASDHSVKGVRTMARIRNLIDELKLDVRKQKIIIGLVPDKLNKHIEEEMKILDLKLSAAIPYDENINKYDLEQRSLLELPDDSAAVKVIDGIMERALATKD
jgi:CO dehydrogenase maturation factor